MAFDPNIIPFYHDSTRAWNSIKRLLVLPCSIPTAVYIESAIEGLWKAGLTVLEPDPKEVYHQALGQSLYHDAKQVIRDVGVFGTEETNIATRIAFDLADLVDVEAWYLFLFSAATEGLIDFSSQAIKNSGCQHIGDNRYATGGPYINAIGDDGALYGDDFQFISGSGGSSAGPLGYSIKANQSGTVAATCGFADFNNIPVPSSTAVVNSGNAMIMDMGSNDPTVEDGSRVAHTWYKSKNTKGFTEDFEVMSSYNGGVPLPLGEAFRDGDKWHGYMYNPARPPK